MSESSPTVKSAQGEAPDPKSPLDVPGIQTGFCTKDILEAVREVRERS